MQNPAVVEADFNWFNQLSNQFIIAAERIGREGTLSPVAIPTMSKHIDGHVKLAHKVVDVMDRANRKTCVTLLRYSVDKPENSYAQVRIFARKKEDEKFHQIVYVNFKLEEFVYLLDVLNSLYDNVIANKPICNVL